MLDLLIIDDEKDICDVLESLFTEAGYTVKTANDANAATKIIASETPALLICDITMPGRSGIQLLEAQRETLHPFAVVMLTAHAESEMIISALRLGALDYIVKPFDSDSLLKRVPAWLEVGKRIKALRDSSSSSPALAEQQMKMIELFRLKNYKETKASA